MSDVELAVVGAIVRRLDALDAMARSRVVGYLHDRYCGALGVEAANDKPAGGVRDGDRR